MINKDNLLLPNRWQCYMGIMVESTAIKNQRWFHVFVPEFMPEVTGDVRPDFEDKDATVGNVWKGKPTAEDGVMKNTLTPENDGNTVHVIKTVYADYWGWSPSEDVPTMYRDMQVMLINYMNTDKWYWIPLERDRSYKTFEHVRISANNIEKANKIGGIPKDEVDKRNSGITDDNTYYIEIDTKYHKHIKLFTGHSDGEKWDYTIEIDPVKNFVEIHDVCVDGSQPNNTIKIESKPDDETKGRIIIENASGANVTLTGKDAVINVPRNLQTIVGGDYELKVKGNYSETIDGKVSVIHHNEESVTVDKNVEHHYRQNYQEGIDLNKRVAIKGQHEEIQTVRKTTSETASWESANGWTLSSDLFMGRFQSFKLETLVSRFDSNFLYMHIKVMTTCVITHILKIASTMLWWLPLKKIIPKKPDSEHTIYK